MSTYDHVWMAFGRDEWIWYENVYFCINSSYVYLFFQTPNINASVMKIIVLPIGAEWVYLLYFKWYKHKYLFFTAVGILKDAIIYHFEISIQTMQTIRFHL